MDLPALEVVLKWLGALLVVLAAIFFVGTAIQRGWIGPEMRLAGATAIGLAMVGGGFHLAPTRRPWALTLTLGGAVILPVCAAAANAALDLVGEYSALILLALVTVAMGRVAMKLSMEAVATVAGVAAVRLPFWIVDEVDLLLDMSAVWMSALVVAVTWLGWHRTWVVARLLTVGLAGLALLGAASAEANDLAAGDMAIGLAVTAVVAAAAWVGPAFAPVARVELTDWRQSVDYRSVLVVPLWVWGMVTAILDLDDRVPSGWAGLVVAAGFLVLAVVARRLPRPLVLAHYLAGGILVSLALATLTSSPILLVGLTVQAVATGLLARELKDWALGLFAMVLGVIAVGWAAVSTVIGWVEELDPGQLAANFLVVAVLVVGAAYTWRRPHPQLQIPATVAAWAALLGWLPSALIHLPQGQGLLSLAWAGAAIGLIVYGIRDDIALARNLGLVTLVVTVAKLLTVDLAAVDVMWRVGVFLVVGVGLLRLAYVLPRLAGSDPDADPDPGAGPDLDPDADLGAAHPGTGRP